MLDLEEASLLDRVKAGQIPHMGKICALINAVFGGLSPVFLKKGMTASQFTGSLSEFSSLMTDPYFIAGIVVLIVGTGIFMVGLSYGKASVLFALFGAGAQFFTFLGGWLLLGENIFTLRKIVGATFAIIAIYLLGPGAEE